ncbi:MAG: quinone-dependent dihydroorotate dehydrogenase [Opitutales bacterium]
MGRLYTACLRPLLFRLDPETAHLLSMDGLAVLARLSPLCRWLERRNRQADPVTCFGVRFPNRLGLAAGMDKDAVAVPAWAGLGFGFVEVGTVTPWGQPGNPRPRLFRYPDDAAVINRMGFNNRGTEAIARRLERLPPPGQRTVPIGINIGKAKVTPLNRAADDYRAGYQRLAPYADYFTINVSSPNTQGLRDLQQVDALRALLQAVVDADRERSDEVGVPPVPLLLKIAPDCRFEEIDAILDLLHELELSGIIATNTTTARPGAFAEVDEAGGLSGPPLRERSTEVIAHIARRTAGELPIIGVGGIDSPDAAIEKIEAGATLLQLYTGLIFKGPGLVTGITHALARRKAPTASGPDFS